MTVLGIHHITLVCSNAQRTVDFYTGVLGQRLVKKTVNFDDPSSYHLYFGDEVGRPGSAITFFEWPGAPQGRPGIGGTHHFALQVKDYKGLLKWKRRLTDLGLSVEGPLPRHYSTSIFFNDPDGTIIEIATAGPGRVVDLGPEYRQPPSDTPDTTVNNRDEARIKVEIWPEAIPEITADMALAQGMHHLTAISRDIQRTHAFFGELLGMQRVKLTADFDDQNSAYWSWGRSDGKPGTLVTYFERDPAKTRRVQMGAGQTHHFALAVPDEITQLEWREKLLHAGLRVSPVMDRVYFKSIYTNDPDGHIVELATVGPGFLVDEDAAHLGRGLKLPAWLEVHRSKIERHLRPLTVMPWAGPPGQPGQNGSTLNFR